MNHLIRLYAVLFIISLLLYNSAHAQSISRKNISGGGGVLSSGSYQISYSIGGPLIPTLSGGSNIISQGFQQPGEHVRVPAIPAPVCAGVPFDLAYTATDIGGGNTFTAQLSNASGSFATPVTIGTKSGNASSGSIPVTITAGTVAGTGYKIRILSSRPAAISSVQSVSISNATPPAPSVTITKITDLACGKPRYRFSAAVTPAATGAYEWSFFGSLGAVATIDSGNSTSQVITVFFNSTAAHGIGDSVKCRYISYCGYSLYATKALTNTLSSSNPPAAPASIIITKIDDLVPGQPRYRYTAPSLPAGTSTNAAATGYLWSFTGTLGNYAVIDSGTVNSRIITVKYTLPVAALPGDSVRVLYTSLCGNGANKSQILSNTVSGANYAGIGQRNISSAGGNLTGGNYRISFNIGEPVIPTLSAGGKMISQGFEQPLEHVRSALQDSSFCAGSSFNFPYTATDIGGGNTFVVELSDATGNFTTPIKIGQLTGNASSGVIPVTIPATTGIGTAYRLRLVSNYPKSIDVDKKMIAIFKAKPTSAPAGISQVLVSNVCGARVFRYTAAVTTNASGYAWTLPVSVGGVAGVTVDSGNINSSRVIKLKYASNNAALTTDSIWVRAYNGCGSSINKAAALVVANPLLAAPAIITIEKITDLACNKPRYRYIGPLLYVASATTVAATAYEWMFTGTLGATAVVDSGSLSSRIFTVYFNSPAASALGDSVKLRFNSACGYFPYRAVKLPNTLTSSNAPLAPASITQTWVSDICGARVFRYVAPVLPAGTATNSAASGYTWTLPSGPLGSTGTLDSGSLSCANCRVIRIKYSSNAGAVTGDSIALKYTSLCGESSRKAFKLTVPVSPPIAPATLTQTLVSDVCGARVYRYSTTALPAGTSSTGYNWQFRGSLFGTLGTNSFIDSGSLISQTLKIRYTSNLASTTGDSAKVQYNSACGLGSFKAGKLINIGLACPENLPIVRSNSENGQGMNKVCLGLDAQLFPNPSTESFQLMINSPKTSPIQVTVRNAKGQLIKSLIAKPNVVLNIGNELKAGIYMVYIAQEVTLKILKAVKL